MRALSAATLPATDTRPTVISWAAALSGTASGVAAAAATGSVSGSSSRRTSRISLAPRSGRGGGELADDRRLELELLPLAAHLDARAAGQLAAQDELRERILEQALDRALQGPRAERGIEPALDQELGRLGRDLEMDL